MLTKKYNQEYNCLEISDAEKEAVESYRRSIYSDINSMLESGLNNEVQVKKSLGSFEYNVMYLENIIKAYSAMFKYAIQNNPGGISNLYRGTTLEDIKQTQETMKINKFLSTTRDQGMAEGYFSLNWDNPASIFIKSDGFVPYVPMEQIDKEYGNNWEKEVVIAPFTKVKNISEYGKFKNLTKYSMTIEKQDLPEKSKDERKELFDQISTEVDVTNDTLNQFFGLNREMENIYFRIQEIQQRLSKGGLTLEDRKDNSEKSKYLWGEYEKLSPQKKEFENKINSWKNKVISYCMAECKEVEKNIENEVQKEETIIEDSIKAKELENAKSSLVSKKSYAQSTCGDTHVMVDTMDKKLGNILNNQLRYKKAATELGITYNEWSNIQGIQEAINRLKEQLGNMKELTDSADIDITSADNQAVLKRNNIDKIGEFNASVNGILNDIDKGGLSQINAIELNVFKKAISDRITEIKVSTDMKKIDTEESKIKNKGGIKKFFGSFTGQNKTDDLILKQIQLKRNVMNKKIESNAVMDLNEQYSLHEMLAEIDLYIELNGSDMEMKDGINTLQNLRQGITSMAKNVDENKVRQKIQEAQNSKLPIVQQNGRVTKEQKIQREAQNWIIQNGYNKVHEMDIRSKSSQPRDDLASRTHKLSDYIELNLSSETQEEIEKNVTLKKVNLENTLELF